jgi:hypothetical protein
MSTSPFWDKVLEPHEKLLWTGRPKPRLHWRNWRLYGTVPMAALGLMGAAGVILATRGMAGDVWLLLVPAMLVLIPVRATWQQIKAYEATRYALTDRRTLFFFVSDGQTRIKAHPYSALCPPMTRQTAPPSVIFLQYRTDKSEEFGFDYVESAEALLEQLERIAT